MYNLCTTFLKISSVKHEKFHCCWKWFPQLEFGASNVSKNRLELLNSLGVSFDVFYVSLRAIHFKWVTSQDYRQASLAPRLFYYGARLLCRGWFTIVHLSSPTYLYVTPLCQPFGHYRFTPTVISIWTGNITRSAVTYTQLFQCKWHIDLFTYIQLQCCMNRIKVLQSLLLLAAYSIIAGLYSLSLILPLRLFPCSWFRL